MEENNALNDGDLCICGRGKTFKTKRLSKSGLVEFIFCSNDRCVNSFDRVKPKAADWCPKCYKRTSKVRNIFVHIEDFRNIPDNAFSDFPWCSDDNCENSLNYEYRIRD
jgi:hypothetical protein